MKHMLYIPSRWTIELLARCLLIKFSDAYPTLIPHLPHTYPILIFDVGISSFLNKTFHSVAMAFAGCNVQRSLLMERNKFLRAQVTR